MVRFLARAEKQRKSVFCIFLLVLGVLVYGLKPAIAAETSIRQVEDPAAQAVKTDFKDLGADKQLRPFVHYLVLKGIIKGFPDGTFRPADSLTRAEAARILTLTKRLPEESDGQPAFSDVPTGHWAFGTIQAARKAGLLYGYEDGTFHPEEPVTRAEAVALLLRISGGTLTYKNIDIADVNPADWAYRAVATAVEMGIVDLTGDRQFKPNDPFRRGDLAIGLSAMLTLGPDLRETDMVGKLTVREGKATITAESETVLEAGKEMPVPAGTKINTGAKSKAEINFDDGSGILLDENTEITITGSKGFNYIQRDGSPGVAVDKFKLNLKGGRIFGALATSYTNEKQSVNQDKKSSLNGVTKDFVTLASRELPSDIEGLLFATGETAGDNQETAWWQEPYAERERVVVDMPWSVASVRGTFWMNEVGAKGENTAVIIGHAVVTSAGQSVSLGASQASTIGSANTPPQQPGALTEHMKQCFVTEKSWTLERAQAIQNNLPQPPALNIQPPNVPIEKLELREEVQKQTIQQLQNSLGIQQQQNSIVGLVKNALDKGTAGVAPTNNQNSTSSSGGGRGTTTITYRVDLPVGMLSQDRVISLAGGAVSLTLPAGITLSEGAEASVQPLTPPSQLSGGLQVVGQSYDIKITGLPPQTNIPITLQSAQGKNQVSIYYYNDNTGKWEYQNSTLNQTNWSVTASAQHFSIYSVLEDTTPPVSDPLDNSAGIPVDKTINVTFNGNITQGSNFSNITLKDADNNTINVNKSISGNVLVIQPASPLDSNKIYTLDVPADAVSYSNAAAEPYNISFSTGQDTQAPAWDGGVLLPSGITDSGLALTWSGATDNVAVSGYELYLNGTPYASVTGTTFNVTGLTPGTNYSFNIEARDAAGNLSNDGPAIEVTTASVPDTQPPAWSSGGALLTSNITENGLTLTWSGATDNVSVTGYELYKNGVQLAIASESAYNYTVTGLVPATSYEFSVKAIDGAGNRSNELTTTVTTADNQAPTWTSGEITPSNITTSSVTLTWTGAVDNVGVTGYKLYMDGAEYASVTGTTYNVSGLSAGASYTFKVEAGDAAGNWSGTGPSTSVTTVATADTQAPTWTDGTITASSITTSSVTLTWTGAADNVGVTGYKLYMDGAEYASVTGTTYNVSGLSAGASYTFKVEAGDAAGNWSGTGPSTSVTTATAADNQAPTWTNGSITPSNIITSSVTLTWTGAADNVGVTGYKLYKNGTAYASVAGTTCNVSGLSAGTTYTFKVEAGDAAGYWSATGPTTSVTTAAGADNQAPTWGGGAITASNITTNSVTLTWFGAKYRTGITGYRLYMNGVLVNTNEIIPNNDPYVVTGLDPATIYTFRVEACNPAGHWSNRGPAIQVSTKSLAENEPPTWPGGCLRASNITTTSVTLSWSKATDNVSVTGYKLYKNDVKIADIAPGTYTYTVSGLTRNTSYTFSIEAGDAAGNWSDSGPTARVKTKKT